MDLNDVLEGEMEKCTRYEVYSILANADCSYFPDFSKICRRRRRRLRNTQRRDASDSDASRACCEDGHIFSPMPVRHRHASRKFLKDADCNRLCDRNIGQIPHSYFAKIMTDKHCELPPGLLRKGSDAMMTEISFKLTPARL